MSLVIKFKYILYSYNPRTPLSTLTNLNIKFLQKYNESDVKTITNYSCNLKIKSPTKIGELSETFVQGETLPDEKG